MMKRNAIIHIVAVFLLPILLAACTDEIGVITAGEETVDGTMKVSLTVAMPDYVRETRAEGSINRMDLLCFDDKGIFIGKGTDIKVTPSDAVHGSLTGYVPNNTCRIHFIANSDVISYSAVNEWIGRNENSLVGSLTNKTGSVSYWGYVSKNTIEEMKTFLQNGKVYLVRDCAKITIGHVAEGYEVKGIAVCNTWNSSAIAPFQYDSDAPFHYYKKDGEIASVDIGNVTIPIGATKKVNPADVVAPVPAETLLYEQQNALTDPVKVILKIQHNGSEAYYLIYLMNDNNQQYAIIRNHEYRININSLSDASGYHTFEEALVGRPANNAYVQVEDLISMIEGADEKLTIEGKNYRIFSTQNGNTKEETISFTLTDLAGNPKAGNMTAKWISNAGVAEGQPTVIFDPGTGKGTISLNLKYGSELTKGVFELMENNRRLSMFVSVYTITEFDFKAKLEKLSEKTPEGDDLYQLTFTIPDDYPKQLQPVECKFAVGNLEAYNDNNTQFIEISSESTADLPDEEAKKWGYWYVTKVYSGVQKVKLRRVRDVEDNNPLDEKIYLKANHFGLFIGTY